MACVRPDGSLTETGRTVLTALARGLGEDYTASTTGLPLYRVRMVIRALSDGGLVTAAEAADGAASYEVTAAGRDKLCGGR